MTKTLKKLIIILGPTASGKTSLAVGLCEKFNGEIISADSRQIYREMNIATNKEIELPIAQHIIDIKNPDQVLSVAQYKRIAFKCIHDIQAREKIPFLTGGTGLYIQSIVDNLKIPEVKPNLILRKRLENKSLADLQLMIKTLDPETAEVIEIKNKRRIIRALEVKLSSGKSFVAQKKTGKPLFNILQIGISMPKTKLYKRINKRACDMVEQGLAEETEALMQKYSPDLPSMSGIGYKEIGQYLKGKITLNQATNLIQTRTRQYAHRQIQWFKRDSHIKWVKNYSQAEKLVKKFLKKV